MSGIISLQKMIGKCPYQHVISPVIQPQCTLVREQAVEQLVIIRLACPQPVRSEILLVHLFTLQFQGLVNRQHDLIPVKNITDLQLPHLLRTAFFRAKNRTGVPDNQTLPARILDTQ